MSTTRRWRQRRPHWKCFPARGENVDQPLDLAPASTRRQPPAQGEILPPAPRPMLARPSSTRGNQPEQDVYGNVPLRTSAAEYQRLAAETLNGYAAPSTSPPSAQPVLRVETYDLPEVTKGALQVVQVNQQWTNAVSFNAMVVPTPEPPAWARSPNAPTTGAVLMNLDAQQQQHVPEQTDDLDHFLSSVTA
ncbi:hypothetical protein QAD02_007737 [Eretmocerus hayati]|uniref:Uncharacterized protein n=1 Tax=Eretmocerus hayati TaxID=131215 RepID=A0ACC2N8U2_9HYME|nr:hypothetical protein QAD02_007737 [Eretmocerus hayati]